MAVRRRSTVGVSHTSSSVDPGASTASTSRHTLDDALAAMNGASASPRTASSGDCGRQGTSSIISAAAAPWTADQNTSSDTAGAGEWDPTTTVGAEPRCTRGGEVGDGRRHGRHCRRFRCRDNSVGENGQPSARQGGECEGQQVRSRCTCTRAGGGGGGSAALAARRQGTRAAYAATSYARRTARRPPAPRRNASHRPPHSRNSRAAARRNSCQSGRPPNTRPHKAQGR